VLAFSIVSFIGCAESLNFEPMEGSRRPGAVISTPAIGPATEGLKGVSLFCASHPARVKSEPARAVAVKNLVRVMGRLLVQ
jgi:hypothetical protein